MRELTMDEIEVVSGGDGMITVTGSRLLTGGFWTIDFDSPTWGDGDTSNGDQSGWDRDGDGVADYYDEDPDDPNNNTMVTKPTYPEAVAVKDFVTEYWGSLLSALAGKHGGKHPIVAAVGADILGNITAEEAGRAAYIATDSYFRGFEQQMRNAENGRFREFWAQIP